MVTAVSTQRGQVRMLDHDQWLALVDRISRRELGISGEEFLRSWEAGEFGDPDERPEVLRVAMLLPSGR
jgi:hypothetical protein